MSKKAGQLNKRQAHFAALVHSGSSQLKAYKLAYEAKTTNADSLRVQANRVFRMPAVQDELKRLVEQERDAAVMSKSAKKARLAEIAERILREGTDKNGRLLPSSAATAVKIYEILAKLDGDYQDGETGSTETHLARLKRVLSRKGE